MNYNKEILLLICWNETTNRAYFLLNENGSICLPSAEVKNTTTKTATNLSLRCFGSAAKKYSEFTDFVFNNVRYRVFVSLYHTDIKKSDFQVIQIPWMQFIENSSQELFVRLHKSLYDKYKLNFIHEDWYEFFGFKYTDEVNEKCLKQLL